ncbi:MAG: nitrate reductase molybdenum cofactor assembly chaperone [Xanthobacteraceae bacterium]|nr:nitrate reductase molybdenum cofactor assembly chaperone [Xanthobacteraceae bacterium]
MTKTFKVFSALLSYPIEELQQAAPELRAAIETEGQLSAAVRRQLDILIEEIVARDLYDLQERYVLLFDRTRSLSLHLFEHVHGESRDRGQAMINLKALYEKNGLSITAAELPDFLPLFLEFLSTRPAAEAYELLGQPAHILSAIAERLRKRRSSYEAVFRALVALSTTKPKVEQVAELLETPDPDPTDLAALDAAWEDEPVIFGPGATHSCKDGLVARIRAARRPAAGVTIPAATRPIISRS